VAGFCERRNELSVSIKEEFLEQRSDFLVVKDFHGISSLGVINGD
jgi:hypothetical protein